MDNSPLLFPFSLRAFPQADPSRRPPASKPPPNLAPSAVAAEPSLSPSPPVLDDPLSFQVDDLLDFPNDDEDLGGLLLEVDSLLANPFSPRGKENQDGAQRERGDDCAASAQQVNSVQETICEPTTSGLCAPPDELADQLEWLSNFNEDSAYLGDASLLTLQQETDENCGHLHHRQEQKSQALFLSLSPVSVLEPTSGNSYTSGISKPPFFRTSVPTSRARSKRSRTGQRIWSLDALMPPLVENRLAHSHSMLISVEASSSIKRGEFSSFASSSSCHDTKHYKSFKKAKKTLPSIASKSCAAATDGPSSKRCTHCLVQKTPQWRAGPMGPKTLCNACGVRFKSGRLVPEYRPACSPTFVNEVHSNSHKRILEMRRMKEMQVLENEDIRAQDGEGNSHAEDDSHSQSHSIVQVSTVTMEESITNHKHKHEDDEEISRPQLMTAMVDTHTVPVGETEESIDSSH